MATETFSRHLIRMARREAGMTQAQLAEQAKTSQAAVSAYESGRRSPSVDTLTRILAAAGFEVRMRLTAPDSHDATRKAAEALVGRAEVDAFNERQGRRVVASRARSHAKSTTRADA